jgi:hypothetical protein
MCRYFLAPLVVCMLTLPCHADEGPVDVHGYNGATLQFRNWDEAHAGWSDIEYKGSVRHLNYTIVQAICRHQV